MPASQHLSVLSVRLPETELRHFKSLAAARGVSLQDAVHQALGIWAATPTKMPPEQLNALEGSLSNVDVESMMRGEREAELAKDRLRRG